MDIAADGCPEELAGLLGDDAQRAARVVAIALQSAIRANHARLADPGDRHALHDFRVSVRRLRSWLDMDVVLPGKLAPRRALKRLRAVAKATNASRDHEVFARWLAGKREGLPPEQQAATDWLVAIHSAPGPSIDARAFAAMERDFTRAMALLDAHLPWYRVLHHVERGAHGASFAASLAALLRLDIAELQRRLAAVEGGDDGRSLHRARIAGKRLRYHLEPIAAAVPGAQGCVEQLKQMQDLLGDCTDGAVWLRLLREAESAAPDAAVRRGLDGIEGRIRRRSARRFRRVQEAWLEGKPAVFADLAAVTAWLDASDPAAAQADPAQDG